MVPKPSESEMRRRIERVVECIKTKKPLKIFLFGSVARGDFTAHSDIDVVVVLESELDFFKRTLAVLEQCDVDFPIDILVYTPQEFERMQQNGNHFIRRVQKEGKVIYEHSEG
jgi:predicted nucleotidyltransferase